MIPKPAKKFPTTRKGPDRLPDIGEWGIVVIFLLSSLFSLSATEPARFDSTAVLTQIQFVRHLAESGQVTACTVSLKGAVLWVSPDREQFILQDDSGGMRIRMDLRSRPPLATGQQVLLEGRGLIGPNGFSEMLINNDGVHPAIEKSEVIYLTAGRHPIRVDWFNALNQSALGISFAGPELPRQPIPDSALFRVGEKSADGKTNWVNGLDYRCYEGSWESVPDFQALTVRKSGTVTNFDLSVRTRNENAGLQFSGFVEVPRTGLYTFWLTSDDGSFLFIDDFPLRVSTTGKSALPVPQPIFAGQPLAEDQDCRWSEIEGTVAFITERSGGLDLELNSSLGLMHLDVKEPADGYSQLWLNSRIRVTGISQSTLITDNHRVDEILLVPGLKQIQVLEPAPRLWTEYPVVSIGQLEKTNFINARDAVVHIRGKVGAVNPDQSLLVQDATGQILVETTQAAPPLNSSIEVLGQWTRRGTNLVLQNGFYRAAINSTQGTAAQLPLLTRIEQVKSLGGEEAQKGYPVRIQGNVTALTSSGFFIQNATWAIFVRSEGLMLTDIPQAGDLWKVDGVTYAEFSPNIRATNAIRLGPGVLPAPVHPTLDQLVNGSMDTRYVEIQGIVTSTESDSIQLLTHEGRMKVWLTDVDPHHYGQSNNNDFKRYENALIRIRGCVIPGRDTTTEQVQVGQFFLCNYSILIDQPAPADPFLVPLKSVADLRTFDPHASSLQLVRIAGQILHQQGEEFFLWDGKHGLRFISRTAVHLKTGETVEVVGFPDLSRRSPVLREASVRPIGQAALPAPQPLSTEHLLNRDFDSSLVRITARLTDISTEASDQILTLQAGEHGFVARLNIREGPPPDLLPGSRLELTGVYVGQGGGLTSDAGIDSFELLVNSPADMVVLERPSWWTLRRLLMAFGVIAMVLAGAILWIFTLRRRVNAQTLVIHQKVEREATLEERARIARDIHDTLEQALAGTSFQLNALAGSMDNVPPEPRRILDVARSMVRHAQEEARRTVRNLRLLDLEKNDLPTALARLAAQSKIDLPVEIVMNIKGPVRALPSQVETHLLRVSQEAITNAIKHAQTKIIQLELNYDPRWLLLTVHDDGCGFDVVPAIPTAAGHFGLLGMRERAEKIGGTLQIQSAPGQGTTIQVKVPLPPPGAGTPHATPVSKKRNPA